MEWAYLFMIVSAALLVYHLSMKPRLGLAAVFVGIEVLLAALVWSENWVESEVLPAAVSVGLSLGLFMGCVFGIAVVAVRLFLYLGQELPRLLSGDVPESASTGTRHADIGPAG